MNPLEYNVIIPYKDRKIDFSKEVKVYRNLSKNGVLGFSILQNGKVVGHTNQLMLRDCVFLVNQTARKKIVQTKRKVVHAFIKGKITHSGMGTHAGEKSKLPAIVKYNPMLNDSFYCENLTTKTIKLKGAQVVKFKNFVVSGAYTF